MIANGDKLKFIPLTDIWWDDRYRKDLGPIDELVESVKEKGILQPITVRPTPRMQKGYKLLAGERRFTAAGKAGLDKIPALIRETEDEVDEREIELIENIHRKDFTWQEKDALIGRLHDLCQEKDVDWSGRKTAQLLGKSPMAVSRALQLREAIAIAPELAECKTEDEAIKTLAKLKEGVIVQEVRRRQQEAIAKGSADYLKLAEANYKIGDTFKGMAELRSNGMVHFLEVDPPYGIDLTEVKRGDASYTKTYNEIDQSEYSAFLGKLAFETYRVANEHSWMIFWFGPTWFQSVKTALTGAGWEVDDIPGIWFKPGGGQTMQPEVRLARSYEPFFICRKGRPILAKRGRANVFEFAPVPTSQKYHPTQRPINLMVELFDTFCVPGQIALIPFLGSGVSIRAAYKAGLKVFGFDLSSEYKDRFMLEVQNDAQEITNE